MKWYKKLLWWCIGIVVTFAFAVMAYGMGSDLVEVFPNWLTASIVGLVIIIVGTVIAVIFAMGIIKIREMFE